MTTQARPMPRRVSKPLIYPATHECKCAKSGLLLCRGNELLSAYAAHRVCGFGLRRRPLTVETFTSQPLGCYPTEGRDT
jgi:hypothetical protein